MHSSQEVTKSLSRPTRASNDNSKRYKHKSLSAAKPLLVQNILLTGSSSGGSDGHGQSVQGNETQGQEEMQ